MTRDGEDIVPIQPNGQYAIPVRNVSVGPSQLRFESNLKILESKVDSYLAFNSDPFFWMQKTIKCKKSSFLSEFFLRENQESDELIMPICLSNFRFNNCTVYDFGIREQPAFGVILSKPPFNCQVFAFDPSPITQSWYATNKVLQRNKNYHLFQYGGGGTDEKITLRNYNWGQVSIYSYPGGVVQDNPRNCTRGACRYKKFHPQTHFKLPVRSIQSLMKEFGHDRIDVLKIDVEGSEYRMLEGMIDSGVCNQIDQMTLEWHHYDYDMRYGPGSAPHLNMFVKLLKEKCDLSQFYIRDPVGWPAKDELYLDMKLNLMYNIASFMSETKQ